MELTQQQFTIGSSVAQGVIGTYIKSLKIDGKWGTFTQSAYDKLNDDQKMTVQLAVGNVVQGSRPEDYIRFRTKQKLDAARTAIRGSDVSIVEMIRNTAQREGVPPDAAVKFAMLESELKPSAVSSTGAVGLFQIMRPALTDVNKIFGTKNGKQFTMTDMRDPVNNALVGIQYMKIAARYAGVPVSDIATMYMAYNIGAGNLQKLRAGKFDDPVAKRAVMSQNPKYGRDPRTYIATVSNIVNTMPIA